MATIKKTSPEEDDLANLLNDLETTSKPSANASAVAANKKLARVQTGGDMDLDAELAEIDSLAARPRTPRVSTPIGGKPGNSRMSSEISRTASASGRTSEDTRGRKSNDSARVNSYALTPSQSSNESDEKIARNLNVEEEKIQTSQAPVADNEPQGKPSTPIPYTVSPEPTGRASGGWWGSLVGAATTITKTAEAALKEVQSNEEAKRWAEQVKGNVGVLRGLGGDLTSRALPSFTNLLHTLAPPISSHERLQIHLTHDFLHYPSLDPLIHSTFSRVMAQVEGGDLIVLSRGSENQHSGHRRSRSTQVAGWNDGPWWRDMSLQRDLGTVKGLVEGTKLVRVSAESFAKEYLDAHGGLEAAAKRATEELSQTNPVRSSDIFLAIQAIQHEDREDLFAGSSSTTAEGQKKEEELKKDLITFAVYIHDPLHHITFSTLSQSLPKKWIDWLDAPAPHHDSDSPYHTPARRDSFMSAEGDPSYDPRLPEEIADIVQSGGIDPREWVSEWVEEAIALSVGTVAQRYVARRMGVGELGPKRKNEEVMADGGGEAARAGI